MKKYEYRVYLLASDDDAPPVYRVQRKRIGGVRWFTVADCPAMAWA